MSKRRNDPTLAAIGEWGFLNRLLPRLRSQGRGRFSVPPGDDAAVLLAGKTVLTVDGLTEDTHFRATWSSRVKSLTGLSLGEALAWKLLGASASDLAAMGETRDRWAMIYLGAPSSTRLSFLQDLQTGTLEAAEAMNIALAGGDTVRASSLSLVASVGGRLKGRALTRRGGRAGDLLCVAGTVGDSAAGLAVLEGRKRLPAAHARYFARRFFQHDPMFEAGARLAADRGVSCAMDVSDALSDCIDILCRASGTGAWIDVENVPVSGPFSRHFSRMDALTGGEDYALLFAADHAAVRRLEKSLPVSIIGMLAPSSRGVRYRFHGLAAVPPKSFGHF